MNRGFWGKISRRSGRDPDLSASENKPIIAMAPMAGATDFAFREMAAKYGKPDVIFTEFVSCDGLCSAGREKLLPDLKFSPKQRPIVAQFFGSNPENFYKCALLARKLGFDGIDINMGCPDKNVQKQNAGAKLILNPELAKKIISETKRGAGKLPVSVKTRIGYHKDEIETWLGHLLEAEPAVITIHGRTKKEMSKVPADWLAIKRAVEIVKKSRPLGKRPLILGNGDIKDLKDALKKAKMSGADGVMIGRAVLGNPWFFSNKRGKTTLEERLKAMVEHTRLFEKTFPESKKFDLLKKHYKAYLAGYARTKGLKIKLMETKTAGDAAKTIKEFK